MASANSNLQGDDLFYGYIAEYLDGDLPQSLQGPFNDLLKTRQKQLDDFQVNRGKFQSALGDIGGSEALKHKLRNFAQDDQLRETIEASEIAEVERSELWSNVIRRSVLSAIVLGIIGGIIYTFLPRTSSKFDVIEYLGYEAMALEEDPDGRINLPSTDIEEIKQFVGSVPGLAFHPGVLRPIKGWNPEGVSIIDYDVIKVVAVNYVSPERGNEHLHHFMVPGKMSDMSYKGEEADYRGLKYRVYGSDKLNIVVWQYSPDMVSVLAGHRSAPELADMARVGTPE
ncbi:MAG: hypothetical protein WCO71_12260 [Pseudomonadota bacterium]